MKTMNFSPTNFGSVSTSRSLSNFDSAPIVVDLPRQVAELHDLLPLDNQVGQRGSDDAGQQILLGDFAFLAAVHRAFFVGRLAVENVVVLGHAALEDEDLFLGELAFLDLADQVGELVDAALEGPQQGIGGTGQAALENAHRQACRGAVEQLGPVVDVPHVVGRLVVERLLADRPLGQVVAQRVGDALRIERLAVEADHLLLGAADEVGHAALGRILVERLERGKHLRLQQPPQGVVRIVLALVRRGGEQQQMVGCPRQRPRLIQAADAGQGLGQAVAIGLADAQVVAAVGRQLVGLVEDHQVVGHDAWLLQAGEHLRARQRVDADDDAVAAVADERVGVLGIGPGDDAELQAEERREFALPVADQAGGRNDQHPLDQAAGLALADVEARHDGLAGPGIVGQQEPQRGLLQHVLVDRDPLVRQRIDLRDLGGEGRVEHVAETQPLALGKDADHIRRSGEVGHRRPTGSAWASAPRRIVLVELEYLRPGEWRGFGLAVLPAIDGGEGHAQPCRQLDLRQARAGRGSCRMRAG